MEYLLMGTNFIWVYSKYLLLMLGKRLGVGGNVPLNGFLVFLFLINIFSKIKKINKYKKIKNKNKTKQKLIVKTNSTLTEDFIRKEWNLENWNNKT